jgi:hypothetical protein
MTSAPRQWRSPAHNTRDESREIRVHRPIKVMPVRAGGRDRQPATTGPHAGARDPADASLETMPARSPSTTASDVTARYRDRVGAGHELRVERSPRGYWRVLDIGPDGARLVEELTGANDHRPQAEALARDYAQQAALAAHGPPDDEHEVVWAA